MQGDSDRAAAGSNSPQPSIPHPPRIFGSILVLVGLILGVGGGQLVTLGGSFYYLLSGLMLVWIGVLLWRRRAVAAFLYGVYLLATVLWSLWEAGLDPWAWAPRLLIPLLVGLWFLTPFLRRRLHAPQLPPPLFARSRSLNLLVLTLTGGLALLVAGLAVNSPVQSMPERQATATAAPTQGERIDWQNFGNTTRGTRFARLDQITAQNVGKLTEIWHYRTGRDNQFKATPIQIDDALYFCTAFN